MPSACYKNPVKFNERANKIKESSDERMSSRAFEVIKEEKERRFFYFVSSYLSLIIKIFLKMHGRRIENSNLPKLFYHFVDYECLIT